MEWLILEATIVSVHAQAARARHKKGYDAHELGRSKDGFTSKIYVAYDALGMSLCIILTLSNSNDIIQVEDLISGHKTSIMIKNNFRTIIIIFDHSICEDDKFFHNRD